MDTEVEIERDSVELKHLWLLRVMAVNTLANLSHLYDYAKQNSGSLKSAVGTVESAVTTVVGPVYEKFKGVPDDVLVFVDRKVDEATNKFNELTPPLAKKVFNVSQGLVHSASDLTQNLAKEAKVGGPQAAFGYAKQSAVSQLAKTWYEANKFQPLHTASEFVFPVFAYTSDKYNRVVANMAAKGYLGFNHVPLIPVEELASAYNQVKVANKGKPDNKVEEEPETAVES